MNCRLVLTYLAIASLACLTLGGCSSSEEKQGEKPTSAAAAKAPNGVQWHILRELDEVAERAEALADAKEAAEMRKLIPDLKAKALAVAHAEPPGNAKDAAQVQVLQLDLANVADALDSSPTVSDEDVLATGEAVHAIVEKLMAAAGLPHEHHHEGDGHDHGGGAQHVP